MKQILSLAVFTLLMFDLAADARIVKTQVTITPGSGTSAGSSSIPGGSGLGSDTRGSSVSGDAGIVRGSSATGDASMSGSSAGASTGTTVGPGGTVGSGNIGTAPTTTNVNPNTGVTTFGVTGTASPSASSGNTGVAGGSNVNVDTNSGIRSPAGTGFQTAPRPIGEGQSPFTIPPQPQAVPGTR